MIAGVLLVSTIVGFATAVAFAVAGASLSTMLAGYFLAGTAATLLMLVMAAMRDRIRAQSGRRRSRRRMGFPA